VGNYTSRCLYNYINAVQYNAGNKCFAGYIGGAYLVMVVTCMPMVAMAMMVMMCVLVLMHSRRNGFCASYIKMYAAWSKMVIFVNILTAFAGSQAS